MRRLTISVKSFWERWRERCIYFPFSRLFIGNNLLVETFSRDRVFKDDLLTVTLYRERVVSTSYAILVFLTRLSVLDDDFTLLTVAAASGLFGGGGR
jgi:hypothetical protein